MPTLLETNLYRCWLAKQTAKGTPIASTAMVKSPKLVAGSVVTNVDSGTENYSDGTQFGDTLTWLNSISGSGSPGLQGDADTLAYLLWLFHGAETVSPAGTNAVQTLTTTGTPAGGTVPLSYDGRATTVPFNATNAQVDTALEALPNIGTGGVTVTGGPLPTAIVITFDGPNTQKRPHPLIVTGPTGLTGGSSPTGVIVGTTPGVNAKHTFIPTGAAGFWLTWCQTVGAATVQRLKMNDGRIGSLTIEASTGAKALHVTPNLLFADPAEAYTTDPTPALTPFQSLIYTEGSGAWTVDGQVFTGQTQFQITLDLGLAFVYGDAAIPFDMARGNAAATLAATMLMDDTMLSRWNTWVYGTPAPTSGTKPLQRVPPVGSYSWNMLKKDSASNTIASFDGSFPGVQWEIPDSPGPAPDSGSTEVALAGRLSRLAGQNPYTMNVGNQLAAYTA